MTQTKTRRAADPWQQFDFTSCNGNLYLVGGQNGKWKHYRVVNGVQYRFGTDVYDNKDEAIQDLIDYLTFNQKA